MGELLVVEDRRRSVPGGAVRRRSPGSSTDRRACPPAAAPPAPAERRAFCAVGAASAQAGPDRPPGGPGPPATVRHRRDAQAALRQASAGPLATPRDPASPASLTPAVTATDPSSTWKRLEAELQRRVDRDTFDIWLAGLRFGGLEGDRLVLLAPAELHGWVAQRCGAVLQSAADAVMAGV